MTEITQVKLDEERKATGYTSEVGLPARCPSCSLNWQFNPPAAVAGSDSVRCIECKTVFPGPATLASQALRSQGEAVAWYCEHGDGSIEVVLWPDARDKYASLGYEITPLGPLTHPAPQEAGEVKGFQDRVAEAHHALFHDDPTDIAERRDRFGEEANELQQALGQTRENAHLLVDYTYDRPVGDPEKEIGAAALTLASLCVVGGFAMQACAEADLAALQTPEKIAKVRAKRSTRHGRGPLPGTLTEGSSR